MKRPSLVRRLSVPLIILLLAALYLLFTTNVGEWVSSLEGSHLTDVLVTR
ncbi:MAG: hypothetical protein Q8R92_20300 [Deltaproteobacteria bacterium]|nr:hypothetical protein [Deltaproteobacteria bacterium]